MWSISIEELKADLGRLPKNKKQKLWWIIKGFLGFSSVHDGSTCWFSYNYFDVHDYPESKGGDGTPSHFYTYTCPRCNTPFSI